MNTVPIPTGLEFNTAMVALVALSHIQIAAYITGSVTIGIASEGISMARHDPRHDRLLKGLVTSWLYVFSVGSAIAIFFVVFVLTGLWAKFYIALQQITFAVFVLEAVAFVAEIALLYSVYANWDRLARHRAARLSMLILLNIVLWWQMLFINVVASFMLTPNSGDTDVLKQVLNPTSMPLTLHRTAGNIGWAGAAIAAFAAFKFLRTSKRLRREPDNPTLQRDAAYWDWVGQWGVIWALLFTLLQPWLGYSYAKEIQLHAYGSWYSLMFGDFSNVFLAQVALLGTIVVLATWYLWRRMRASGAPGHRRLGAAVILILIIAIFDVQPAWFAWTYGDVVKAGLDKPWWSGGLLNPLGNFIPYKVACLSLMVVGGLYVIVRYLLAHSRQQLHWGQATRRSQGLLIGVGVSVSLMMMLMGFIREGSRGQYLINGELTVHGQRALPTQLPEK